MLLLSDQFYASTWMMVSAFLYSLQNVDARFSGNVFGFWTMCVFRGLVGSLLCASVLCWDIKKMVITRENRSLLLLRSLLGGATIITLFFAILKCDLSTVTIITSTSSLWTALLGYMISPQKYQWKIDDLVIALWCLTGIIILFSDQSQGVSYYVGIVCALLSAIFQSAVNLTIKQLEHENPAWVALWGMMGSVILGLPGLFYELIQKQPHFMDASALEWTSLTTTGVLSASAQYCKTYSIQISHSMSILILRHLDAIFSVVWDVFLFHERLTWQTITGIPIVLSGCLAKLLLEQLGQRQTPLPLVNS